MASFALTLWANRLSIIRSSTMAIAEPVYTDWLHQQVRVKPDHLLVHNLSAERRNRLRNDYQLK